MTEISDLARDLVEEILSRVPLTSLRAVRSTCKRWNDFSKNHILGQKAGAGRKKQLMELMTIDSKLFSLKFDLQGIRNNEEEFVHPSIKQISIPNHDQVEVSRVFHCDGILLCLLNDPSKVLVWNPYLGQSRLIQTRIHEFSCYALGYDNKRNHKILRFLDDYRGSSRGSEVYHLNSGSWRVLDLNLNPSYVKMIHHPGVSLKGNIYFLCQSLTIEKTDIEYALICFDFTTERFGQRLPLPFPPPYSCFVTTYSREDKLVVLYIHCQKPEILEIWISTKIEPNEVSWSTFLKLDLSLINGLPNNFLRSFFEAHSFFIDEEKKVAVFFSKDTKTRRYQMVYVIGDGGYLKSVNLGVGLYPQRSVCKLVGSSYFPSLVKINQQNAEGKMERDD